MPRFTVAEIPSQSGRTAIVTGASPGGLGYETALALAGKGAHVVLAGRGAAKLEAARAAILKAHSKASVAAEVLDLASLASIEAFATRIAGAHGKLNLLINNAGIMAPPKRELTADGFEVQFGVNHLGHFALTGRLLPLLRAASGARVVNVSSLAHTRGRMAFDDLQGERDYSPWRAYSQSKLANLLFTLEFERRGAANAWGVNANAAHPGIARTELIANGPGNMGPLANLLMPLLSHSSASGALPTLVAAVSPEAKGGDYWGPSGIREMRGPPAPAKIMPLARDEEAARRLWEASEKLTGVGFG
jgi:NAD(P)-dependent dehydrogenase (short-subunit alcohol dehydrogenase family)